jgi:hypothetical protein
VEIVGIDDEELSVLDNVLEEESAARLRYRKKLEKFMSP